jgi:molecular chaperone GrpE
VPQSKDQEGFDRIKARPTEDGSAAEGGSEAGAGSGTGADVGGYDTSAPAENPAGIEQQPATVEADLAAMLDKATRERDEYLDISRRVQADFENYKKRMLRQQTDYLERASEDLVAKVLPVLDAFDLARVHLGPGDNLSAEGKALVAGSTLLSDTLAREGLERIGAAGDPFDPTTHEAVDHVSAGPPAPGGGGESGAGGPEGLVVDEVLRAGYRWKGRVIRPAMVRVRG